MITKKSISLFFILCISFCVNFIILGQAPFKVYISEDCTNGMDDDGDGYVDYFDEDCPCNDLRYNAQCDPLCQEEPEEFSQIELSIKWTSEKFNRRAAVSTVMVGKDFDQCYLTASRSFNDSTINFISALDITSGQLIKSLEYDTTLFGISSNLAVADVDSDGIANLFVIDGTRAILNIDESGDIKWKNSDFEFLSSITIPNIADINADGNPELYIGNKIINSNTGTTIFDGSGSAGCNFFSTFNYCSSGAHSVAGDFTDHPGLELACGNQLYEIDINNPNDTIGNTANIISAPSPILDGYTSMADVDNDGMLDIVVVRSNLDNDGGIWVWNPRDQSIIAQLPPTESKLNRGSIASIGDLDDDCFVEIVITFEYELRCYSYNGTGQLNLNYSIPTSDESGHTGITIFDLNNDGNYELLYRDETTFKIIDGKFGFILEEYPMYSITGNEQPIVTDVDNDGSAEILITGGVTEWDSAQVFCFESANEPWAPARSIWNQTGYHVTNINDDLTIPLHQQNISTYFDSDSCIFETCPQVYNRFQTQATYRNQNGCIIWPLANEDIEIAADYTCKMDSINICIYVTAVDTSSFNDSINITLFLPPWEPGLSAIHDEFKVIEDTICIMMAKDDIDSILIVINNDSGVFPPQFQTSEIQECDYENNILKLHLDISNPTLNLGPDFTICLAQEYTLNAGTGFESYLWQDNSNDSTFTSNLGGVHFVEAIDNCGNMFRDTIVVTIDSVTAFDLEENVTLCPNETLKITIEEGYESILWSPADKVDCTTCFSIEVASEDDFQLIAEIQSEYCTYFDTVNISIIPIKNSDVNYSFCSGEDFVFLDSIWTSAGTYTYPLNNCDSIVTITLNTIDADTTYLSEFICSGDSILFGGNWIGMNGEYSYSTDNILGCDSLLFLELTLTNEVSNLDTIFICNGDSIPIFDQMIFDDQLVSEVFTSSSGCDSIQSFQVISQPLLEEDIFAEICEGDSILFGNLWIKDEGNYTIQVPSSEECDSLLFVELVLRPRTYSFDTVNICEGDTIGINDNDHFFVPNIFSPNDDGINDKWSPIVANDFVQIIECIVFDRWGNILFQNENTNEIIWNGRINNERVTPGVYVFALKYYDPSGRIKTMYGDISIVY